MTFEEATDIGKQMDERRRRSTGCRSSSAARSSPSSSRRRPRLLGLAFAIFILIVAFGSVLAMGLPDRHRPRRHRHRHDRSSRILSHVLSMPDFTTTLAVMIGLGVGIDYALFIVTRYREGLHNGLTRRGRHRRPPSTPPAGPCCSPAPPSSSRCSACSLMGLAFVTGLGHRRRHRGGVTMVASVTLLPALLGFAKHRVEVTRWRGIIAASLVPSASSASASASPR